MILLQVQLPCGDHKYLVIVKNILNTEIELLIR